MAVDVTDVDDTPGSERAGTARLGRGAAVKVMDSSVICHPAMVALLEDTAREGDIPVQRDIMRAGGTDAGAIHLTRTGVITGGISVPCRYIHTPAETARPVRRGCLRPAGSRPGPAAAGAALRGRPGGESPYETKER